MRKRLLTLITCVSLVTFATSGAAALGGGGVSRMSAKPVRLAEASLIVEVNATDGDAGLQVFLDGDPWRSMTITGPDGRKVVNVIAVGRLQGYGLTELFSESSEPAFDEFPLAKFKSLFPEGRYRFSGVTIEGRKLTGTARLSHDIPDGPAIVSPDKNARVDRKALVAKWTAPRKKAGIEIAGYRVIVERDEPLRVFSVDLSASARQVTIPREFLSRGAYKVEVQAIEKSGNQTLTEVDFRVT
jgi:hypothetical protein